MGEIGIIEVVGSLWEYGALVVLLTLAIYKLWGRVNYLQDQLIELSKAYSDAIHELSELIKGDSHDDK